MFSERTALVPVTIWRIVPLAAPTAYRRCPRCNVERGFTSSNRFRVNANGRLLDVWLIYRCIECDATWNLVIHSRATPHEIGATALAAYQCNDAATARRCAFDLPLLTRAGSRVVAGVPFRVEKPHAIPPVIIQLELAAPVRIRLSRLLTHELGLTRRELSEHITHGRIAISPNALNGPAKDGQQILVTVDRRPHERK